MSKRHQEPRRHEKGAPTWHRTARAIADLLSRLIDRFGWPGLTLVALYVFVDRYATPAQKQEIIDKFILGKSPQNIYVVGVTAFLAALIIVATWIRSSRRIRVLEAEVERLAAWKTAHQETRLGALHHSKPRDEVKE